MKKESVKKYINMVLIYVFIMGVIVCILFMKNIKPLIGVWFILLLECIGCYLMECNYCRKKFNCDLIKIPSYIKAFIFLLFCITVKIILCITI